MFENVLNRVQPGVYGGNFSQWHAEPDSEETFSKRCHASTKEPQQGPLLSTFVIQQNLSKEEDSGKISEVEQYITIPQGVPTSDHQVLNPFLSS